MTFANSINQRTTTNQLLVGAANNATSSLATANNSVLVTSSAGVPSMSTTIPTAVQQNIATLANQVRISSANPATANFFEVVNTDLSANSDAKILIAVGTNISQQNCYFGVFGGSNNHNFLFGTQSQSSRGFSHWAGSHPDTGTLLSTINELGVQTLPLQPAFSAYLNSAATNVTGDGTVYAIGTAPLTAIYDQNTNFDPLTGIFTTPIDGVYSFVVSAALTGITTETTAQLSIVAGAATYYGPLVNAANSAVAGALSLMQTINVTLAAADQVTFFVTVSGGTLTVGLDGTPISTYVSGAKIA